MNKDVLITTKIHKTKYDGLKEFSMPNRTIMMLEFDTSLINSLKDFKYIHYYSLYILVNNKSNNGPSLYIGQTNDLFVRTTQHIIKQDVEFDKVIAFIRIDNGLTKTYVDYVEYYYINKFNNSSFDIMNKSLRMNEPSITEIEKDNASDMISTIDDYLSLINLNCYSCSNDNEENEYRKNVAKQNTKEQESITRSYNVESNQSIIVQPSGEYNQNAILDSLHYDRDYPNLNSGWYRGTYDIFKEDFTFENIKKYIYKYCFEGVNQRKSEILVFGEDRHGALSTLINNGMELNLYGLQKILKSNKNIYESLEPLLDERIHECCEFYKKIYL